MDKRLFEKIIGYHEETKHHFDRFSRSGYMDWENQPNPFRFYIGSESVALPLLKKDPSVDYNKLYFRQKNGPQPLSIKNIAGFMELAMGLSAWKSIAGSRWSLRMNPSSGNLHPTVAYLILPSMDSLKGGVYHYNPLPHALELRAEIPDKLWGRIQNHFGEDGFGIALTSIFWRESWKYGERAYRYCNHDVGHALAGLSYSGSLFGWQTKYLNGLSDAGIETILGMDQTVYPELEEEHPDLLCFVCGDHVKTVPRTLARDIVSAFSALSFSGKPNKLSNTPVNWELIYKPAAAARKAETAEQTCDFSKSAFIPRPGKALNASEIIRQRRSAVDFDPEGFITRAQFFSMLDKTIPRSGKPPFDVELMEPAVDLLIFVHAVKGLEKGLYFFFRGREDIHRMRHLTRPEFSWTRVKAGLSLFLLEKKDFRRDAKIISCDQDIAGSSAFSLGMIAKFKEIIETHPHRYRFLFWEAGMVGQVLYLEAEAQGVRGTGIGCFFDDEVHRIIGLKDNSHQSIYHFTVGKPVEDRRLITHPPYDHLRDNTR